MYKKTIEFLGYALCLYSIPCVLLTSCHTMQQPTQATDPDKVYQKERLEKIETMLYNLKIENETTKKNVSLLKQEMQANREELLSQKRNLEILRQGVRSGIFQDTYTDDSKTPQSTAAKESGRDEHTPVSLPSFALGQEHFSEPDSSLEKEPSANTQIKKDFPTNPQELLALAADNIRKTNYQAALKLLNNLRQQFPNYDDQGESELLTAQSWLKLKEFDQVIPPLRNFYLKYPTSAHLAYAKLLEAQAQEANGNLESAGRLYHEVVSLSPESDCAELAKNGVLRIRNKK